MLIQSPTAAGLIGKAQLENVQIACDLGLTHAEGGAQILAQSRRSVKKNMIQRFISHLSCFDKYFKVLGSFFLSYVIVQRLRS